MSVEKVKEGVFIGPQIRKLSKDPQFLSTMTDVEKKAWLSFSEVVSKFLGNIMVSDSQNIVENMLAYFEALGCRLSLKVHFLHAHLDYFQQNLGDMSKEHEEQSLKNMLSPGHQNYGNSVPRAMRCINDGGLLLVPETRL